MDRRVRRYLIYVLAAIALITLAIMVVPQLSGIFDSFHTPVVWAFWISFVALVVVLFFERDLPGATEVSVEGPAFSRFLFNNTRGGPVLAAHPRVRRRDVPGGRPAQAGRPKWTEGGASLLGYWQHAVAIPDTGSTGHQL